MWFFLIAALVMQESGFSLAGLRASFERQTERELWPDYEPRTLPYLVFDGVDSWLVGHPAPPAEFARDERARAAHFPGLHPTIRANTSIDLAGVRTGTLLMKRSSDPAEAAAVLVHELFHVHQDLHFPGWSADEMALLTYPHADGDLLVLRRLESEALVRALDAGDEDAGAAWARLALELRSQRHAALQRESSSYEDLSELKEGLAQYLQYRALGRSDRHHGFPPERFGADGLRRRIYASGEAWALLLDRYRPGWSEELVDAPATPLTELLREPLEPVPAAELAQTAAQEIERRARRDAVELLQDRRDALARFEATGPGWNVVVRSSDAPLSAQGFDPTNMSPLDPKRILHRRWVKLGNQRGTLECLDRESLTVGAGSHPLFQGVSEFRVVNLAEAPRVEQRGSRLHLEGGGLTLDLESASLQREGTTLRIDL